MVLVQPGVILHGGISEFQENCDRIIMYCWNIGLADLAEVIPVVVYSWSEVNAVLMPNPV